MSRKTSDVFRTAFLTMDGTFDTNNSQLFFRPLQAPLQPVDGNFYSLAPAQGTDPTIRINQYDASGTLLGFGYPYDSRFNILPPGKLLLVAGSSINNNPPVINTLAYSQDGISWVPSPSGRIVLDYSCLASAYNSVSWLAGGEGSLYTVAKSSNGRDWIGDTYASAILTIRCQAITTNGPLWIIGGKGENFNMAYSFDGLTWYPISTTLDISVAALATANNIWLAGGGSTSGPPLQYSADGVNWTDVPDISSILSTCQAIGFNGQLWVAGGNATSSSLAYSLDAINWEAGTNIFPNGCYAVAWNGLVWTAGGQDGASSGNTLAYSYDGKVWSLSPSTGIFSGTCTGITWDGASWIASGLGPFGLATSNDGIIWTGSIPGTTIFAHANTVVTNTILPIVPPPGPVPVKAQMVLGSNNLYYTADGIEWTPSKNGQLGGGFYNAVAFNGVLWTVGNVSSGTTIRHSYDGVSWTPASSLLANGCYGIASGASGEFIAVGERVDGSGGILRSVDGIVWTDTSNNFTAGPLYAIAFNGHQWVAGGINTLLRSTNGTTWTSSTSLMQHYFGFAWNGQVWVGAGSGGASLIYSFDGITWTNSVNGTDFLSIAYTVAWNGQLWIAGGVGDSILVYSYDGITWRAVDSPLLQTGCKSVSWNGSLWVAVGDLVAYSYNGIEWIPSLTSLTGVTTTGANRPLATAGVYFPPPVYNQGEDAPSGNLVFTNIANNLYKSQVLTVSEENRTLGINTLGTNHTNMTGGDIQTSLDIYDPSGASAYIHTASADPAIFPGVYLASGGIRAGGTFPDANTAGRIELIDLSGASWRIDNTKSQNYRNFLEISSQYEGNTNFAMNIEPTRGYVGIQANANADYALTVGTALLHTTAGAFLEDRVGINTIAHTHKDVEGANVTPALDVSAGGIYVSSDIEVPGLYLTSLGPNNTTGSGGRIEFIDLSNQVGWRLDNNATYENHLQVSAYPAQPSNPYIAIDIDPSNQAVGICNYALPDFALTVGGNTYIQNSLQIGNNLVVDGFFDVSSVAIGYNLGICGELTVGMQGLEGTGMIIKGNQGPENDGYITINGLGGSTLYLGNSQFNPDALQLTDTSAIFYLSNGGSVGINQVPRVELDVLGTGHITNALGINMYPTDYELDVSGYVHVGKALGIGPGISIGQTVNVDTGVHPTSYTVGGLPTDVFTVTYAIQGGGGGGGGSSSASSGGGGGGGGLSTGSYTVYGGTVLTYSIGAAGVGGLGGVGLTNNGTNGGNSTLSSTSTAGAKSITGAGGVGGRYTGIAGTGGTATGGTTNTSGSSGIAGGPSTGGAGGSPNGGKGGNKSTYTNGDNGSSGTVSLTIVSLAPFQLDVDGDAHVSQQLYVDENIRISQQLYVDGSSNLLGHVGIGRAATSYELDVSGTAHISNNLDITNRLDVSGTSWLQGSVGIGKSASAYALDVSGDTFLRNRLNVGTTATTYTDSGAIVLPVGTGSWNMPGSPANTYALTFTVIGGGGGGSGSAGGGGGYTITASATLQGGSTLYYTVGAGAAPGGTGGTSSLNTAGPTWSVSSGGGIGSTGSNSGSSSGALTGVSSLNGSNGSGAGGGSPNGGALNGAGRNGSIIITYTNVVNLTVDISGAVGLTDSLYVGGSVDVSGASLLRGNVGIGMMAVANTLDVSGNARVSNKVGIGIQPSSYALDVSGGVHASGTVDITSNLDVSGTSWLQGNVGIGKASSGSYAMDVLGGVHASGTVDITSNLDVSGTSWLQGNVGIGKASSGSYAMDVLGSVRILNTLDISNNLDVSGTSWLQGNVGIGKASNASYALDVSGTVRIGDLSGVVITRNTTVINPGSVSIVTNANADLGLGVNNAAQFVINRTMDTSGGSSFGPVTDASSNLGGPSYSWKNLYVNNVRSPGNMLIDASGGGTTSVGSTITLGSYQGLQIKTGYVAGPILTPSTTGQLLFSADASSHAVFMNTVSFGPQYSNMSLGQPGYVWTNLYTNNINPQLLQTGPFTVFNSSTPGTYTVTLPTPTPDSSGIISCYLVGAGGGASTPNSSLTFYKGVGGNYLAGHTSTNVSGGTVLTVTVGAAGGFGYNVNAGPGQNSSVTFPGSLVFTAFGGRGATTTADASANPSYFNGPPLIVDGSNIGIVGGPRFYANANYPYGVGGTGVNSGNGGTGFVLITYTSKYSITNAVNGNTVVSNINGGSTDLVITSDRYLYGGNGNVLLTTGVNGTDLEFGTNGNRYISLNNGYFYPLFSGYNLGSSTARWNNIYTSNISAQTINWNTTLDLQVFGRGTKAPVVIAGGDTNNSGQICMGTTQNDGSGILYIGANPYCYNNITLTNGLTQFNTSVNPYVDDTYDIGSSTKNWNNLYVNTIYTKQITAPTSTSNVTINSWNGLNICANAGLSYAASIFPQGPTVANGAVFGYGAEIYSSNTQTSASSSSLYFGNSYVNRNNVVLTNTAFGPCFAGTNLGFSGMPWDILYVNNIMAGTVKANVIQANSKSFVIDHPDPALNATHFLRHCTLETPTAGDNVYRWILTTTNKTVYQELPSYSVYLNKNWQFVVSPTQSFGSGYVTLASDEKSFMLTVNEDGAYSIIGIATRKDKAAQEFDKTPIEYLKNTPIENQ